MPPAKRGRDADAAAPDETEQKLQRTVSAVDDAVAEFVCPISQSLPVDPVMAEDDKVYERASIEEWLARDKKSPMTGLPMGNKLRPATQVKNMIRKMVESGTIVGEKADAWKEKLAEEEEVADMRRWAENGEGSAMYTLGIWYEYGKKGLAQDDAKAFEWYTKSHEAGNASGTSQLGQCYLEEGWGVERSVPTAFMYLTIGAMNGSKRACSELGETHADGLHGARKNIKLAREWYSKVATAPLDDLADNYIEKAAAWVREHPA